MSTPWTQPPPPSILSRRVTAPSDATPGRIYTSKGFLSSTAVSTRCFKYQLLKICLPNERIPYSPLRPLLLTWHVACTQPHRSPHLYSMRGFLVPHPCQRSANHTATQPSFSDATGVGGPVLGSTGGELSNSISRGDQTTSLWGHSRSEALGGSQI